jgi:hypothetical protein
VCQTAVHTAVTVTTVHLSIPASLWGMMSRFAAAMNTDYSPDLFFKTLIGILDSRRYSMLCVAY